MAIHRMLLGDQAGGYYDLQKARAMNLSIGDQLLEHYAIGVWWYTERCHPDRDFEMVEGLFWESLDKAKEANNMDLVEHLNHVNELDCRKPD